MKKKKYVKPETVILVVEAESFICLSYKVENNGTEGGGDLVPPTHAGDGYWNEEKPDNPGKGDIWGDLD